MNRNAVRLNLKSSMYDSPHGMANPLNRSTAFDVAKLGAVCMKFSLFCQVVSTTRQTVKRKENDHLKRKLLPPLSKLENNNEEVKAELRPVKMNSRFYRWENTHKMVGQKGVNGIKTGVT
jgi:D-alanyl-D-alanine carboxypeptidase